MYVLQELLCVVVTKMKYDESYSFDQAVSLPVVLFPLFNTKIKIVLYACLCYSLNNSVPVHNFLWETQFPIQLLVSLLWFVPCHKTV